MPDEVIQEARRIAHGVRQEETLRVGMGASARQAQLEAVYSLAHKVACVAQAALRKPQVFTTNQVYDHTVQQTHRGKIQRA